MVFNAVVGYLGDIRGVCVADMDKLKIYEQALKLIVAMMYDHDPFSGDYKPDSHLLEECCCIAGEALDYVRGVDKEPPEWLKE